MSNEPIVTPLVDRLSWSAWLKPFFIHPSVTAGGKKDMNIVRAARKDLAEAHQEAKERTTIHSAFAAVNAIVNPKLKDGEVAKNHDEDNDAVNAIKEALAATPEDASIRNLNQASEAVFTTALSIKNEALRKSILDAIVKVSPQYKAYREIIDIAYDQSEESRRNDFLNELKRIHEGRESFTQKQTSIWNIINTLHHADKQKARLLKVVAPFKPAEPEVHDVREVKPYVNLKNGINGIIKGAFLRAIGFHGYNSITTEVTTADGQKFYFKDLGFWHSVFTFLGFPTRLNVKGEMAEYNWRVFVRDLFGGWDSLFNEDSDARLASRNIWWLNPYNYTFEGKRLWNTLLLPVKFVIAAYYTVTFPIKLALNVARVATDVLAQSLLQLFGFFTGKNGAAILALHYSNEKVGSKVRSGIPLAIGFIISFAIHHAARLAAFVAEAVLSPAEFAARSVKYALALNSRWKLVFAVLAFATSVFAVTAVLWAVVFPVLVAKLLVAFPALASVVASISQFPIIASTIQLVGGAATFVAGTIPAGFTSLVALLASSLGVTLAAQTVASFSVIAFIAAPTIAVVTPVANVLSNAWTRWQSDWTLLEAGSQATADVAVAATTALLEVLPSDESQKLSKAFQTEYYGFVESEKLLEASRKEQRTKNFDERGEKPQFLEFPEPVGKFSKI